MTVKVVPFENIADEFESLFEHSFGEPFKGVPLKDDDLFFGCHIQGELVGWMTVRPNRADRSGYLSWGAMLPKFRGNREAQKIFACGIYELREQGMEWLHFISRRENRLMQIVALKLGFLFNGTVTGKDGALEVMMHKHIGRE